MPEGCIGLLSVHIQPFVLMPCTGPVTSLLPSQGEACGCMDHKGDMDQSEEQGTSSWVPLTPVPFLAAHRALSLGSWLRAWVKFEVRLANLSFGSAAS